MELPGHDRREERRARRRGRQLVRWGEEFDSDDLDQGEIELELPEASEEPTVDIQAEPWNVSDGDQRFANRLRLYREFLATRTEDKT